MVLEKHAQMNHHETWNKGELRPHNFVLGRLALTWYTKKLLVGLRKLNSYNQILRAGTQ